MTYLIELEKARAEGWARGYTEGRLDGNAQAPERPNPFVNKQASPNRLIVLDPRSQVMKNLIRGHDLAWGSLRPVFEHAMAMAREAEYVAENASNLAQTGVPAAYPPLVELLSEAGRLEGF